MVDQETLAWFWKLGNSFGMARITGRQRALATIDAAMAVFSPDDRDKMARAIMGLQLVFGQKPDDICRKQALERLEGGVVDLLLSSMTSLFSKAGRDRWLDGLILDAKTFAPDLCARALRVSR